MNNAKSFANNVLGIKVFNNIGMMTPNSIKAHRANYVTNENLLDLYKLHKDGKPALQNKITNLQKKANNRIINTFTYEP